MKLLLLLSVVLLLQSVEPQFTGQFSQFSVCPANTEAYRNPGSDSPKVCSTDQFNVCPQGYECYFGFGSTYGYCCSSTRLGQLATGSQYQQCYDDYPTYCNLNRAYCSQYPVFQQSCKKTCGICVDRRYSSCPNGQTPGKSCTYTSECPVYSSCINSICCPQFDVCPDGSQPRQQCDAGGFCPSGSFCHNGGCCQGGFGSFPSFPSTSSASNCLAYQCQSYSDCPSSYSCQNGRCCQTVAGGVAFGNLQLQTPLISGGSGPQTLFPGRCNQEISQTSNVFADSSNVFRPRCTYQGFDSGFYEMVQCASSTRSCWCVDPETGSKIIGTEAYGYSPNCPSCIQQKGSALTTYSNQRITTYVPQCTSDGNWAARQCSPSAGVCWCVNKFSGVEIAGTRAVPGQPEQIC